MTTTARPPYDSELQAALSLMPASPPLSAETLPALRALTSTPPIDATFGGRPVEIRDHAITTPDGAEIVVSIMRRTDHIRTDGPGVFTIHGGGMILGDRLAGVDVLANWVEEYDAVLATVEYRLAPEFPDPIPVEDCYAGLAWFASHSAELGFDSSRIMVAGGSAGGGLAAGVVLLARDRHGPEIAAQLLMYPMLDDRDCTVSASQFDGIGIWARGDNQFGWKSLLGDRAGTDDVSIYAAPARATELSNLPPAFLEVGSAEVFRDEVVAYASKIWAAGGQAELHVWNGGFHAFEMITTAALTITSHQTREAWVRRHLGF